MVVLGVGQVDDVVDALADELFVLEDRLDRLCVPAWQHLGEARCLEFLDLIEPVGSRLVERIDQTAGPNWMPAARDRPSRSGRVGS